MRHRRNLKIRIVESSMSLVLGIVIVASLYAVSWIITCGFIKLITMCFGWTFKWNIATGIWLIICILKSLFNNNK